jgi:hypothetical protein
MDRQFDAYFQQRISELETSREQRWTEFEQGVANEAVDTARAMAPLRSDAQLLLYMLAREFVAAPLRSTGRSSDVDTVALVSGDITTIVQAAAADSDGVTAHAVITALSNQWDNLQTTSLAIWG